MSVGLLTREPPTHRMQHHFHRILLGYHMNDLNPIKPQLARIRDMLQLLTASQATAPIDLLAIATNPKDLDRRRMLRILKEKARHGAQIHPPDSKLFGQSIRTLLSPPHPELDESFEPLLMALQKSRWIKPGRPEESPFLGMLCGYGGKMFGVFTREERGALEDWIRGLPTNSKDIDEVEDGMGGPETGVEDETGGRSMERSSAIATATDRINSVTAHLRFSTNHNSDTSLLARALPTSFEVPGPVLAAARSFLDSLFSSPTDISHSAFAQNSLSSRIMNSNLNPAILKLEGVLLDSFFVPALHPTPIGEALLKVRMAQGDYSRGMEGRPIWEIWGGVLARERWVRVAIERTCPRSEKLIDGIHRIDTDTDSSELDEYKTYIHALSRHPQSHTPELLGALLHLSSLLYAPSGLSERFNLALFERTRVEEVREATRKGCEELHRRIPKEWNGRVERGWAAGRRLIAETARG